ncbi:MAG: ATP synthase F1 subunit delta [Chitinophagaceae bacterium]|nr:ATP synthase F1 subunit delta [Chitinophagaceae bacterium]
MNNPRLAQRYAKSLIDLAIEMNQLEQVNNDMLFLNKIIKASREFVVMLESPVIPSGKKISIVSAVTGSNLSQITDSFIKLLCHKNREAHLPEIITAFIEQYNTYKGIHTATLTTATPVGEGVLNEFRTRILESTKVPHLNLETRVNDKLIGGFVLEMEGKLIDASILRDLNDIKKQFDSNEYMHRLR